MRSLLTVAILVFACVGSICGIVWCVFWGPPSLYALFWIVFIVSFYALASHGGGKANG